MKKQKLSNFMNTDEFIKIVATKLEEKHKVYPLVKVGNFKVKSKNKYYTLKGIMSVLNDLFKQGEL